MDKRLLLAVFGFFLAILTFLGLQNKKSIHQYDYQAACSTSDFSGVFDASAYLAYLDGKRMGVPDSVLEIRETAVLGFATEERWIEVDLSDQKLKAWEGDNLFLETSISSGLPWTKTPEGEFRIWIKLRSAKMEGGSGKYYYYLPNVPYVMFFENEEIPGWKGYGLHGTYWHDDFGTPRSHGCVNLPTDIAGLLYDWTLPQIPSGKWMARATQENPGTRIVIHN